MSHPPPLDVVVVAASLSGLLCACQLRRQGLKLRLLEARERCGVGMHGYTTSSGLRRYPTDYDVEAIFHWQGQAGQAPRWPAAGPATWEGRSKRAWRSPSR